MSHHVRCVRTAGRSAGEKHGTWSYSRRAPEERKPMLTSVESLM